MRLVQTNGIKMRIAEMGSGPLVVLLHGWPESWYSWRHQLPALANAGFRGVAPDMRGFGKTDAPMAAEDYDNWARRTRSSSGTTGARSSPGTVCCSTPIDSAVWSR